MKNTEMNTKRGLFLVTMHSAVSIIDALRTLNKIGFRHDAPVMKRLYKCLDVMEYELNKGLNLKTSIGDGSTLSWWMSDYLVDKKSVVEADGKEYVIDTPEKLWDLMVSNKEV